MQTDEKLNALRRIIDDLDTELVKLLAERKATTDQVGRLKAQAGLEAHDAEREKLQAERLTNLAANYGVSSELVIQILHLITKTTVENHRRIRDELKRPS